MECQEICKMRIITYLMQRRYCTAPEVYYNKGIYLSLLHVICHLLQALYFRKYSILYDVHMIIYLLVTSQWQIYWGMGLLLEPRHCHCASIFISPLTLNMLSLCQYILFICKFVYYSDYNYTHITHMSMYPHI